MNIFEFTEKKTEYKNFNTSKPLKIKILKRFNQTLLKENDLNEFIYKFTNIAYLLKSNNIDYISDLNEFDSMYEKFINTKKDLFSCDFKESTTIIPYSGSKKNRVKENNEEVEKILKHNNINMSVDLFAGAMNLTLDNLYLYDEYNVNKIVINDINKVLIETYKTIRNNPYELINELCTLYYYISTNFNTFELKKDKDCKKLNDYLDMELNTLLSCHNYSIRTIALFYYVVHQNSSFFDFDLDKNQIEVNIRYGLRYHTLERYSYFINKIRFYSYALNIFNIEFLNMDYKEVIEKYDNKAIFLIDPPYTDYNIKDNLISGGFNYTTKKSLKDFGNGKNGFNQNLLLENIKSLKSCWTYWNNHHLLIKDFRNKEKQFIKYDAFDADYQGTKDKIEIHMTFSKNMSIEDIEEEDLFKEFLGIYYYSIQNKDFENIEELENTLNFIIDLYLNHKENIPNFAEDYYRNNFLLKDSIPEF